MDRESYEAGFRAAQQQSAQEQPQSGGGFFDAAGRVATGIAGVGIAAGAGLAGRRLMRGKGNVRPTEKSKQGVVDIDATPTGSQRDRVERNARTAVNELSKRQGSLVTGVKLPTATEVSKGNFPVQNAYKQDLAARGTQPSETSNLGTTAETPGQSPRTIAPDPWEASKGGPVGKTAIADQPTTQDRRLALPASEESYEAPGRIDPQEFVSSEVREARRQQASQDLLAARQARTGTFQPEIPGVKGDLMAIRSKEGFDPQVTGEVTAPAPSRPLSAAPEQQSIDFSKSYLQDKGYVDTPNPEKTARIARNQARDKARLSDYMSDTLESVISEAEFTSEAIPSDILKLAERAGTGNIDAQDVNTFKNWAQGAFKNDPVVLGEMNEILSSVTFKTPTNQPAGTSTETQAARRPLVVEQSAEASDTAVDQMAGRIDRNVQRDIDVNLNEFQRVDGAATDRGVNPVAAAESAAKAVDSDFAGTQTDRAVDFLRREREEIASQLAEQGLPQSPSRIESELGRRFGKDAWKYGPEYTEQKQRMQLGATYDPKFFDEGVAGVSEVKIAGQSVPTEDLRQDVKIKATADRLKERIDEQVDWLGSIRLEEASKNAKRNAELININRQYNETLAYSRELTDFLDSKRGTPEQRTRARQRLDDVNYELDRLDTASESLQVDIYERGQSAARVRGAEEYVENYKANATLPRALKPGIEDGQRLYFELDSAGEPIPGTQEIRPERRMIDTPPKGGGGRNVAQHSAGFMEEGDRRVEVRGSRDNIQGKSIRPHDDAGNFLSNYTGDLTQTKSTTDIYGVRPSDELPSSSRSKPSEPRYSASDLMASEDIVADPYGDVPVPTKSPSEIAEGLERVEVTPEKRAASNRSLQVAEAIRRARIEGRDTRQVLRNLGL